MLFAVVICSIIIFFVALQVADLSIALPRSSPHNPSTSLYTNQTKCILIHLFFPLSTALKNTFASLLVCFCSSIAMRTSGINWRDCKPGEVVIQRVFSRIFSESSELEAEMARCQEFNVRTCSWRWPEEQGRTRLVLLFETPVPSDIYFAGTHGAGLLRAVGQITLPSHALKMLIVPKRCYYPH